MKNLQDLGSSPFLHIVPILPYPLPSEVVKGEHLKLLLRGSSQEEVALKPLIQPEHLPMTVQESRHVPQEAKKKKKKTGQAKAAGAGLEGFVD